MNSLAYYNVKLGLIGPAAREVYSVLLSDNLSKNSLISRQGPSISFRWLPRQLKLLLLLLELTSKLLLLLGKLLLLRKPLLLLLLTSELLSKLLLLLLNESVSSKLFW